MFRKFVLTGTFICINVLIISQSYFTTGGIRLGQDYGLSLKQRIAKKGTVEAILFSDSNGKNNLGIALIADQHKSIITRNFNLFYGSGLTWQWEYVNQETLEKKKSFGIPLQAGIEFTAGRINLSWDFTPILYISTKSHTFDNLKGLSVRYVFLNKKEGKRLIKKITAPFRKHKK
ncbi:MAG: hypothetical protein ABI761_08610 [Saprospiraceae bacterium]